MYKRRNFIICLICVNIPVIFIVWNYKCSNKNIKSAKVSNHLDEIRFQDNSVYKPKGSLQHKEELKNLRDLVKRRLWYIQNPKNCTAAKKVICRTNKFGFGSVLHQLTFCLIAAYATERTLVLESKGWKYANKGWETVFLPVSTSCTSTTNNTLTNTINLNKSKDDHAILLPMMQRLSPLPDFMPLAIPDDIADRLERVHINPAIWWIGQFVDYLIRPNQDLKLYLQKQNDKMVFSRPMVGIHVRRTDKIREASFFKLEEYMDQVNKWINQHVKNKTQQRHVFIATDSPNIISEAQRRFPNYTFVYHEATINMSKRSRYSTSSLKEILSDVHTLAMCDFVICTMSSNICRLVHELKESRDGTASERLISLDTEYFFNQKFLRLELKQKVLQNGTTGLVMKGFSVVKDKRKNSLRPLFTSDRPRSRVVMPVYPGAKEIS